MMLDVEYETKYTMYLKDIRCDLFHYINVSSRDFRFHFNSLLLYVRR